MKQKEYIKTVVHNGHMINIGMDDDGQQYFLEFVDDDGHLTEVGCGAYNENYQHEIEYLFGTPVECTLFGNVSICAKYTEHGYCSRCPANKLVIERDLREAAQQQRLTF